MKLKEYIKSTGTTVRDFSKRIGVHEVSVSRYISGDSVPTTRVLQKIIKETDKNVGLEDFLPGSTV